MATKTKTKQPKTSSLFVISSSPTKLLIPYSDRNGKDHCLTIPPTWIPIDLTLSGSRKDILNAPNFKNAQNLKLLRVIDEEEALEILKGKDANQEHERIYQLASNINLKNNGAQNVEVSSMDSNDEVLLLSITELDDETSQNNRFRTLKNSGLMSVSLAKMVKKHIKSEPDKTKRNRGLFNLCNEFLEEAED